MTRDLCAFGMEVFSGNAMKRILTKILTICALPLLLIACWQLGSMGHWWGSYIVPPPERVWSSWLQLAASGQLARHIGASLMRVMTGFAIAAALALPCGIWLGLHPAARRVCHSLLEFLRNVPPLALLPMLILWFGIGEASKIIIVVLATFFPIFLNTLDGMSHPDEQLLEMGRVYGLSSRAVFWHIRLPQALPAMYTGLRIGLASAKALSFGWQVPIVGIETPQALAWNFIGMSYPVCVLIDAQKGNVYASTYLWHEWDLEECSPISVMPLTDVLATCKSQGGPVVFCGDGAILYQEQIKNQK